MAGVACPLVFIQHNLPACVHPSGAVNPHIISASGRASILIYQYGHFVCLQHRVAINLFMQVIIEDCKVMVCILDRSVRHVLPGNMQAAAFKLLLLAVKGNGIDVFCVYHCRLNGRGHKAPL